MYREIGLLLVLLLPVAIFLLSKQVDSQQSTQSNLKKSKKKNKKKANKAVTKDNNKSDNSSATTDRPSPSTTRQNLPADTPTSKSTGTESPPHVANKTSVIDSNVPHSNTHSLAATPQSQPESKNTVGTASLNTKNKEIDEHMDMTARYSRVMRIRTESPDEPLSPVPYEDGWSQVSTAKPQTRSTQPKDEPLTKKQRENQNRAVKKKELKAQADAIQEQRLKKHQRQLEKEKMAAFYSTGAGKHTQWGSKPRIPRNQAPSSSENASSDVGDTDDQLIWD